MKNEIIIDFSEYFKELEEIWDGGIFGGLDLGFIYEDEPSQVSDNNDSPTSSTYI